MNHRQCEQRRDDHLPLPEEELPDRLHRMFNARTDNVLYLDGADEAPYGSVLEGIDLARSGGATPVVILTEKLD